MHEYPTEKLLMFCLSESEPELTTIQDYCSYDEWNPEGHNYHFNSERPNIILIKLMNGQQDYDTSDFLTALEEISSDADCRLRFVDG